MFIFQLHWNCTSRSLKKIEATQGNYFSNHPVPILESHGCTSTNGPNHITSHSNYSTVLNQTRRSYQYEMSSLTHDNPFRRSHHGNRCCCCIFDRAGCRFLSCTGNPSSTRSPDASDMHSTSCWLQRSWIDGRSVGNKHGSDLIDDANLRQSLCMGFNLPSS